MREEIVRVCELHHVYPGGQEVRLAGQDFTVRRGERVTILGPNGSGKTTLLMHVMGLLSPTSCQHCHVFGLDPKRDFQKLIKRIGVVFQKVDDQIIGPTVWDDVAFGPKSHGMPPAEVAERVAEALRVVGIEHLKDRIPHYLSGGEKKKVAIAGALAMGPDLLILDEPFDNLDPRSKTDLLALLNRLNQEKGTALVVTTHDVNLVPAIADTVYVFSRGRIVSRGTPMEIFVDAAVLQEANLEPPAIVQLFFELHRRGLHLTPPNDVQHAADELWTVLTGLGYQPPQRRPRAAAGEGE